MGFGGNVIHSHLAQVGSVCLPRAQLVAWPLAKLMASAAGAEASLLRPAGATDGCVASSSAQAGIEKVAAVPMGG